MKKTIFTLALLLSVFALSAQRIVVTEKESGNVVESGASYCIYGDGSASYGYPGGPLQLELIVTASADIDLIGEKVENNIVEGTMNDFCLESCYAPTTYVSPVFSMAAGATQEFSMHYVASDYTAVLGEAQSMTYYLYEEGAPDDKFIVNVVFAYSLDGIEDYSSTKVFSNAYPMPASDVVNFDYNFASSVNAEVAIFNMMGQEVLRNEINGMSGKASINVSDLADGVYFYSLIINGKTEKSNKLIIRH